MKCLIACEFSGCIREEFKKLGWDAWSCDLLDTEIPGQHIKGDVLDILDDGWDLMVAHPPCTFLTNSGVCWLYNKDGTKNKERWKNMRKGAAFFKKLLNANIPHIAVENPIPHKYAVEEIGRKYDCLMQPYHHGHPESKATCLWLKNLPKIVSTKIVKPTKGSALHKLPPSPDRWKLRSKTYTGIGRAIASQFTEYVRNKYA